MKTQLLLFCVLLSFFISACVDDNIRFDESTYSYEDYYQLRQELNLPEQPFDYNLNLPPHIRKHVKARPISNNMASLGRVLFYDTNLSQNGRVSCASCHKQELAFADNRPFSLGFNGDQTARNSIALGSVLGFAATYGSNNSSPSLEFGTAFFWDERAHSASEQSLLSITDNVEMGMTHQSLVEAVKAREIYQILFKTAFPANDYEITSTKISLALEAFIESIGSFNSKLDQAMEDAGAGATFENVLTGLSFDENRGKALYINNCQSCHGNQFEAARIRVANNGLDLEYEDRGVGAIVRDVNMDGVFKVPTLRNIALTAPYMHDGRFGSLQEVLDFYSTDIKDHRNLDVRLKNLNTSKPHRFNFTETEKRDIILFLLTLTDQNFLSEEKYSDPFKR
ncbi:MAG: cytochrome c peroxidase [Bacteroidia bacterium]|nr:cytochrome c peroxidase [Bacteroidia bacterium]